MDFRCTLFFLSNAHSNFGSATRSFYSLGVFCVLVVVPYGFRVFCEFEGRRQPPSSVLALSPLGFDRFSGFSTTTTYAVRVFRFGFQLMYLTSVTFELEVLRGTHATMPGKPVSPAPSGGEKKSVSPLPATLDRRGSYGSRSILLKGQMRHIKEIDVVVFLCSPV